MASPPVPLLSPEQYLEIERKAEFRSEYLRGEVFAVAGGSMNHAWIIANTLARLSEQLRGTSCGPVNDVRLHSAARQMLTYPDVVVTCEPHRFLDSRSDTLVDATVIVEVLSPSTQSYDRGDKFAAYRTLPSFSEYLLLSQSAFRAEHYTKQADGTWLLREHAEPGAVIEMPSIGCRLVLETLYERVKFEQ